MTDASHSGAAPRSGLCCAALCRAVHCAVWRKSGASGRAPLPPCAGRPSCGVQTWQGVIHVWATAQQAPRRLSVCLSVCPSLSDPSTLTGVSFLPSPRPSSWVSLLPVNVSLWRSRSHFIPSQFPLLPSPSIPPDRYCRLTKPHGGERFRPRSLRPGILVGPNDRQLLCSDVISRFRSTSVVSAPYSVTLLYDCLRELPRTAFSIPGFCVEFPFVTATK